MSGDTYTPLRAWAATTAQHRTLAGASLPEDEGRVLTVRMRADRKGPAHVRYEIDLHSNVGDAQTTVHFDVESPFPIDVPERVDAAVLVALFPALHHGGTLRVEGVVSSLLARNLIDFQATWFRARPDQYRPFRVELERTSDAIDVRASNAWVMPFSGGLDSMLALCRHTDPDKPLGAATVDLGAGLFMPGFSPNPTRWAEYPAAAATARKTAALRDLPLVVAETNFTDVVRWIGDAHGALLGAGLTLLAPHFRGGLIGSSIPHAFSTRLIFGSTPAIDPLLSSDGFEIRDDCVEMTRGMKPPALARYPDMLDHLVVCFEVEGHTGNCGRCEKCTRTMLEFIAAGLEIPKGAFPNGIELGRIGTRMRSTLAYARESLAFARAHGVHRQPALRRLARSYRARSLKYWARRALTRCIPSVDLIQRDGPPPEWLMLRKARAAAQSDRGPSWQTEPDTRRRS